MIKIYCIECLETGEKYIGSTRKKYLSDRIAGHRVSRNCRCKQIIDRGNYKYYIIEEVEPTQRLIREQYHMDNTDNCINRNRALAYDIKEYKKHKKRYHELNKESRNKNNKEYQKYRTSWGGNYQSNNNLLKISLDLFN
tara:strand:+ start:1772 stop:2188 length:417 start_codon:yes stop_codon:yes gene_type:complete